MTYRFKSDGTMFTVTETKEVKGKKETTVNRKIRHLTGLNAGEEINIPAEQWNQWNSWQLIEKVVSLQ